MAVEHEVEDSDFFGSIGDVFTGIFDQAERVYNRYLDLEALRTGTGANPSIPYSYTAPQQATPAPTAYPTGSGPFYGVSTETMVMIAGAAIVALVLLRR